MIHFFIQPRETPDAVRAADGGFGMITIGDLEKVDTRIGTVLEVSANKRARVPAYNLKSDFGGEIGIRTSSAQITARYGPDELIGSQVVAVVNFPPRQIADVKSEVLVLGSDSAQGIVLLRPTEPVRDGDRIC
jgi:tRNA-binding protein